ncbi:hypothetical protein ACFOET_05370 [Parapedobacter deserti]|uniref:Uncharacterized protein n=1 Tax=Parapedobacter deserti TaxID=1912957 RepID=A0ABV7JP11_9SPHI
MKSSLLTLFYISVLAWNAFAQDEVDKAKYELLRETINFLATDKAVSKDTGFTITCETLDYNCFKQQLSKNSIAGIERWYSAWQSMEVADEAGLVALRNQVFADILERPGKGYRKQLTGYNDFVTRLENLIHSPVEEVPAEQLAVDTALESPLGAVGPNPIYPEQVADNIDNPENNHTMIAYLAIAIGILALVVAALPIFNKRDSQPAVDFQRLEERLDELGMRIKRLEQQIADNQLERDAIANLTAIMESVEKRVSELENR